MEMNTPDRIKRARCGAQGVVGKPLDRVDGQLKVTGGARYAYEVAQGPATPTATSWKRRSARGGSGPSIRVPRSGRPGWYWC